MAQERRAWRKHEPMLGAGGAGVIRPRDWGHFGLGIGGLLLGLLAFSDRDRGTLLHRYAWIGWAILAPYWLYRSYRARPSAAKTRRPSADGS